MEKISNIDRNMACNKQKDCNGQKIKKKKNK